MDPHMTNEDRDIFDIGSHRRLKQELAPPCPQPVKKKKLVNFKVSLRRRSSKDQQPRRSSTGSITFTQRPEGRKNSVTFFQEECGTLGSLRESCEDDQHLHDARNDSRNVILERQGTRTTKERREAFRSTGEQRMAARRSYDRRSGSTAPSFSLSREQDFRYDEDDARDTDNTVQCDENLSRTMHHSLALDTHRRSTPIEADMDSPIVTSPTRTTSPRPTSPRTTSPRPTSPRTTSPRPTSPRTTSPRPTSPRTTPIKPLPTSDSSVFNSPIAHRRGSDFSRSSSVASSENWSKIKMVASPRSSRINSLVEMLITRRRASLAPSIWTPSVPRSGPGPRPANFQDQEERGKGTYIVSFIVHTAPPKSRPHARFRRLTSLPLPEREERGEQYLSWLSKLVANPLLCSGVLLKGLEIGVQYPVIHLREIPKGGVGGGEHRRLEASLGNDSSLFQGEYEEVVAWVPELLVTCPSDPSQWARCYIVLGFMTLDGDLNEKMEKAWKEWTGALFIYCNIDDDLGLKKLSFYRRRSPHHAKLFSYMVIVEIDTVTRKNSLHLLDFVYRMRLRSMSGYISVYQSHSPEVQAEMKSGIVSSCVSSASSSSSSSSSAQSERTTVSTTTVLPEFHADVSTASCGRMSL